MAETPAAGDTPQALADFNHSLPNLVWSLKQRNTKIIALGSSSTAGRTPVVPYPAYLELMLRQEFGIQMIGGIGKQMINVINRGVGGEEATNELRRMQVDVIDEAPALVIWQVGTNAVFHSDDPNFAFDKVFDAIAHGLERLAKFPIDVILMDSQYTTAVVTPEKKPLSDAMVKRISEMARDAGVGVFRRYALMQQLQKSVGMEKLVDPTDPDKLHLSEWATQNVTQALFDQIKKALDAEAVT